MKQKSFIILLLLLAPGWSVAGMAGVSDAMVDPPLLPDPVSDSDFYNNGRFPQTQVVLGQKLFFDRILSGNKNISCATCHHPNHGTSDGVSLSMGEGAVGLAGKRHTVAEFPVSERVPRNSPALFFLGAKEFKRLFLDGRVEKDDGLAWPSGYWTPARDQLPKGLHNVLAAQVMFPVTSHVEMAGQKGENSIADAVSLREFIRAWDELAARLQNIPEYVHLFKKAYSHIGKKQDIRMVDVANAIAAFETVAFRADNSPFDAYLRTANPGVLSIKAQRGMRLFYGRAKCAGCHSGKFQTDQSFHAIAMPQIGPGKNDGWDQSFWQATGYFKRLEDHGRGRVTLKEEDYYKFRTPSLRNVALTGPWGHAGTFQSLEGVIKHHASPVESLNGYRMTDRILPAVEHVVEKTATGSQLVYQAINPFRLRDYSRQDSWVLLNASLRRRIADANELKPTVLSAVDIDDLVEFLNALTDPSSRLASKWIPESVPSGLPVDI